VRLFDRVCCFISCRGMASLCPTLVTRSCSCCVALGLMSTMRLRGARLPGLVLLVNGPSWACDLEPRRSGRVSMNSLGMQCCSLEDHTADSFQLCPRDGRNSIFFRHVERCGVGPWVRVWELPGRLPLILRSTASLLVGLQVFVATCLFGLCPTQDTLATGSL